VKKYEYFTPKESFNLKGMLSNPMMLIMIFGGVLMLATPYITVSVAFHHHLHTLLTCLSRRIWILRLLMS